MEIVWSETALETFYKIIDYLFDNCTEKKIRKALRIFYQNYFIFKQTPTYSLLSSSQSHPIPSDFH